MRESGWKVKIETVGIATIPMRHHKTPTVTISGRTFYDGSVCAIGGRRPIGYVIGIVAPPIGDEGQDPVGFDAGSIGYAATFPAKEIVRESGASHI
jgi:hypothetical protein